MTSFSGTLREAALIVAASIVLGFLVSAATQRGLFAGREKEVSENVEDTHPPQFIQFPEAKNLFQSDSATFVDGRHEFDYKLGHIKGAINIPLNEFSTVQLDGIRKDRILVAYCDGQGCNSSVELAKKLSAAGYTNVKIFFGGWTEWTNNNQPAE